jgi:protein-tyrosine phosphatase
MIRVLFVCLGNICRSPMAEAVFQDMVEQQGLAHAITSDSAGTGGWHSGEQAHPGTLKVLEMHGIHYTGRARQLQRADLDEFDYVLAMDDSNYQDIQRMGVNASAEIRHFLHYSNTAGTVKESIVPDPYYDGRFNEVFHLVVKGNEALLDHIRKENDL